MVGLTAPIKIPNIDNNNNNNNINNSISTDNNNIKNQSSFTNEVPIGKYSKDLAHNNNNNSLPIGTYSSSYSLTNNNKHIMGSSITTERTVSTSQSSHSSFKQNSFNNPNGFDSVKDQSYHIGTLSGNSFHDNSFSDQHNNSNDINNQYLENVNTITKRTPNYDDLEKIEYVNSNTTTTTTTTITNNNDTANERETQPYNNQNLISIAEFPTSVLLEMLTALLEKIVSANDELSNNYNMGTDNGEVEYDDDNICTSQFMITTKSFSRKHIPSITIEEYLLRIQKYCPTTNDIFLSILVYFDRISKKCNSNAYQQDNHHCNNNQNFVMDSHNIHRLLISAITVSTKFFSDFFYSNGRYARVGGISLQEMNHLELQFLLLCDFKLSIPIEELQRYADLLYKFWESTITNNNKNK